MIEIEALSKARGAVPVLSAVSLAVAEGEVMAIVGPSGGGKSTLLRCLNGLENFDSGAVSIAGHALAPGGHHPGLLERLRRDVGMVFQQFNLFPNMSVLENVATAPRVVARVPLEAARERALALLDRVGLSSFASARPATLSGGQQQRVAIARALLQEPRLILADEPVASLDPANTTAVMDTLKAISRDDKIPVLCNLHDLDIAMAYADRVVAMRAGKVVFDGLPSQLSEATIKSVYEAPAAA